MYSLLNADTLPQKGKHLEQPKHEVEIEGVKGIVETVGAFFASGEIIPPIGNSNAIAIQQVKVNSDVGADARKGFAKPLRFAQNRVDGIEVAGVVVHVGIAWSRHRTTQW